MGTIEGWEQLGAVTGTRFAAARLAVHWAAQAVAAAGASLVAKREDWSHTALSWQKGALVGEALPGGARAALSFEPFELFASRGDAGRGPGFPLAGRTLDEATAWLGDALGGRLTRPEHELPASPIATGGRFEASDAEARRELGRWFANAALALAPFAALAGASPVRCWPHHFDVATLVALDAGGGEHARSIGAGLSPGDASFAEPYWYVTPWPRPEPAKTPPVRGGRWHTEGWFGAVLPASSLLAGPAADQATVVAAFLADAVAAGRALLARR